VYIDAPLGYPNSTFLTHFAIHDASAFDPQAFPMARPRAPLEMMTRTAQ
jgi:hypothetical protein